MSDFERMIKSMIEKEVEPLKETISKLSQQLVNQNAKEYLSAKEVQEIFSISRTTLWRCHSEKKSINKYLIEGKTLFKRSEIESLIQVY